MKTFTLAFIGVLLSSTAFAQAPPPPGALPTFFMPNPITGPNAVLATGLDGAGASAAVRTNTNTTTGVGHIPLFTIGAGSVANGAANVLFKIGAPAP